MSRSMPHYRDFRRYAAPAQVAQQLYPKTISAPTRGLILNENPAFMQPNAAMVLDNWFTTENTIKIRGGSQTWCYLPETTPIKSLFNYVTSTARKLFASNATKLYETTSAVPALIPGITITDGHFSTALFANMGGYWLIAANDAGDGLLRYNGTTWVQLDPGSTAWVNNTSYAVGALAYDLADNTHWRCLIAHTSAAAGTFAADRAAAPPNRWTNVAIDNVPWITGPVGSGVEHGKGLTQIWKYRRRLFFIQGNTMDAWYLDIDAVGGVLKQIPLSGSFSKGGSLLFGCTWSVSAGDGIDDKCIFVTTEGEIAVFTGNNPDSIDDWKQQGRYQMSPPMGKNAWLHVGGDVLIITVDGIVPVSQTMTKDITQLEFSAITRMIHPLWMEEIFDKNDRPWSMCKWDEHGALFVTTPGGLEGDWRCFVANTVTGAWNRYTGWDALQFCVLSGNMFFGTQDGRVVQADVLGKDYSAVRPIDPIATPEGSLAYPLRSYNCVYVGGWEVFGSPPFLFTLRQARCSFTSRASATFFPYVGACINYIIDLPPPPPPGDDFAPNETWDEGLWGSQGQVVPPDPPPVPTPEPGRARWDQEGSGQAPTHTTMWLSIGETGWSHAPIVQVSISQSFKPDIEMLGISMLAEKAGVAV